jgi:hypothetical protein
VDEDVSGANLVIQRPDEPMFVREFVMAGDVGALAWSADGRRLIAVVHATGGGFKLTVIPDATTRETLLTVTIPRPLPLAGAVSVTGELSFSGANYDGVARTLTVTRTDNGGVHALPDVTTDNNGAYAFTDAATPLGRIRYTIGFPGDSEAAAVTSTVAELREVPWDVNADGFAEVVAGAAGEDIGADATTGTLHVLYGRPAGLTGTGSVAIHQDSVGVPGENEDGDQFGFAQASGDFNADGFADVAVSANAENVSAATDGGAVTVFYGSAAGLRTDNAKMLTIATAGFPSTDGAFFGSALAAGDFDGDGDDDLAIGAPGMGFVFQAKGGAAGLSLSSSSARFANGGDDLHGFSLAAGDINGDGMADLAVGGPNGRGSAGHSVGVTVVYYGSSAGLDEQIRQLFRKETTGVPGSPATFVPNQDMPDSFGYQVALADFSGDGRADLAVSAPGSPVTSGGSKREDAGTVTVLYSNGTRLTTTGAIQVTQDTAGMPGAPRKDDGLGLTLAAGDSTGDGLAELAVWSADGYVSVVPGAAGALAFPQTTGWTQDSPGVPGASEAGDAWGGSLRFVRALGVGVPAGLLVGAPGENSNAGAITFLPGAGGTGLTGTGSKYFSQNSAGIPGNSESGDLFGSFY